MGELDEFLSATPGYFRVGGEKDFPWSSTGKIVWYALFTVEGSEIKRYGFTSAKQQKKQLLLALESIRDDKKAILLGIWTGSYSTHLFILDRDKAVTYLSEVVG